MAEMGAIRMFMRMRAFDKIPLEGTISYKDLAASLGAEEALISARPERSLLESFTNYSTLVWHG